ncbi:hypothetical protein P7K49_013517, partial [Saguinus oedipus]
IMTNTSLGSAYDRYAVVLRLTAEKHRGLCHDPNYETYMEELADSPREGLSAGG